MKNLLFSFLHFCLILLLGSAAVQAQMQRDTIHKYYNSIVFPGGDLSILEGISFYTLKKEYDIDKHDTLTAIQDLRLIALGEMKIGNIYDSESAVVEAITLIDQYSKKDTVIEGRKGLYNQLGNIYRDSKNYDKALDAYKLSLKFSENLSDSITIINNQANIYKDWEHYQKANELYSFAYKKIGNHINTLPAAMILDNLGYVQSKLGNPDALVKLKSSLKIREKLNNLEGIYSSNKHLALYYFDRNDTLKAMEYANKAYNIANELNSITFLQDALSLFVNMDEDPKIVQFKNITDSIANAKQIAENKNAFIKYNVALEKKKTADALLENEQEKNQKLLFLILIIIISLTSIFIYFALRIKHKKEKLIQVHNTESRISKKVHDEVANDVYQLMAKIQRNTNTNEALLDDLENIYHKTRDISKENSVIDLQKDFSAQLIDLLLNYQTEKVSVVTRNLSKIDWTQITEIKKTTIYRVLQELMTNMKKHSEATAVVLSFQQTNKRISIEYSDNGKGSELNNKNGLQNAENRIQTLNGTIIFDSMPDKGFKAKITI